jgi:hypothetical protein
VVFSFKCFIWVDLAHAHTMLWLQTSHLKPLWSFSFWLVISLYALINNVLSLCMIMAIIALLVGRSQSLASLHLYWVWALLVHPTPKKPKFAKCVHHTYLYVVFHRHSKVNCLCATFKTFKSYYLFCVPVLAHEEVLNALLSLSWLHTLTSMNNVLVLNIAKRAGKWVPSPLNITNNQIKLRTLCTWEIINLVCAKGELYGSRSWSH